MAQVQGSSLLDVLKKKMRLTKEEMEKYKEDSEDMGRKLQTEIVRREEVIYPSSIVYCRQYSYYIEFASPHTSLPATTHRYIF